MKKTKQILAVIGIILLVLLYLSTLVCAIIDRTETMRLFMASIFATVVIPVLIWAYTFIYRLIHKNSDENEYQQEPEQKNSSLKDKANLKSSK